VVHIGGDSVDHVDKSGGIFGDKGLYKRVRIVGVKFKERKRRGCGGGRGKGSRGYSRRTSMNTH